MLRRIFPHCIILLLVCMNVKAALSLSAEDLVLTVKTKFGDVVVIRDRKTTVAARVRYNSGQLRSR